MRRFRVISYFLGLAAIVTTGVYVGLSRSSDGPPVAVRAQQAAGSQQQPSDEPTCPPGDSIALRVYDFEDLRNAHSSPRAELEAHISRFWPGLDSARFSEEPTGRPGQARFVLKEGDAVRVIVKLDTPRGGSAWHVGAVTGCASVLDPAVRQQG